MGSLKYSHPTTKRKQQQQRNDFVGIVLYHEPLMTCKKLLKNVTVFSRVRNTGNCLFFHTLSCHSFRWESTLNKETIIRISNSNIIEIPPLMPHNINVRGLFVEFMIYKNNLDECVVYWVQRSKINDQQRSNINESKIRSKINFSSRVEVLVHRSIPDEDALAVHDQVEFIDQIRLR